MSTVKVPAGKIKNVVLKHLAGQHNQKRHGWRYGNLDAARRSMRAGVSDDFVDRTTPLAERSIYRYVAERRGGAPAGWVGVLDRTPRPKPKYGISETDRKKADSFKAVEMPRYYKRVDDREIEDTIRRRFGEVLGIDDIHGKEMDKVIRRLESDAKKYLSEAQIVVRAPNKRVLEILESGRFKSQFETGTSKGALDPGSRKRGEEKGLGVPLDINPSQRPIYGYARGAKGKGYLDDASGYGDVQFVFKDSVRKRTTFTFDDSLFNFGVGEVIGSPVNKPRATSFSGLYYAFDKKCRVNV